ncbi:hypothetical protein Tco_0511174 [Tanacetum coccineum]
MELKDIISSSLRKNMKELQQLQERLKEIKKECNKNIQGIKRCVETINPGSTPWNIKDFQVLFGEEFKSFREGFVRDMDQLEIQLDKEEVHECDSKKCLTWLKEQFETFLYPEVLFNDKLNFENQERIFQNYTGYSIQGFKDYIICDLNGIEKGIDARAPHEEVLRIKERDVKERRKKERSVIEFEMMRLEKMIQKGKCSSPGDDTDAKRLKQSKKKCLIHFQILHTLLEDFSKEDLTNAFFASGFQRAFSLLFGENVEYFAPRLFFNMDKLEKQLNEEEFNE